MAFNPYYGYTPQYGKTPYYMQQPMTTPQYQSQANEYMQNIQPATYQKPITLQGKSVDNIEVVKATDIPLDGSVSYFPLVDGSAIVTKQLQPDGTSRMIVYKPVETQPKQVEVQETYITEKELDEKLSKLDNKELKEEIEKMKKQIKDLMSNTISTKSK